LCDAHDKLGLRREEYPCKGNCINKKVDFSSDSQNNML